MATPSVTPDSLFVLQQDNAAKKLTAQVLENWLLSFAEGHGGIQSYKLLSTAGLVKTYRFTLADQTYIDIDVSDGRAITSVKQTSVNGLTRIYTMSFNDNTSETFSVVDGRAISSLKQTAVSGLTRTYTIDFNDGTKETFTVTDGRSITDFRKTGTVGLEDTYTLTYNDGTTGTLIVTNGAKGDKGDNAYLWIKYASHQPTESSHSFGDVPDTWIGLYSGTLSEAPTDWKQYTWFQWKGDKGDTGAPATLVSSTVTYQVGDSGTIFPSGTWSESIPPVPQGKYLWTREVTQFNTGTPITKYSVARFGIDGSGSVSSVANVSPDENGNVPLTASDIKALPIGGGDMEGPINMNGQTLGGLNAPAKDDQAANKGYVDQQMKKTTLRSLTVNSDFRNPVNQRRQKRYTGAGTCIDRWLAWNSTNDVIVTVEDGYLTIAANTSRASFQQRFPKGTLKDNQTYTLVYKMKDGSIVTSKYATAIFDTYDYVEIAIDIGETVSVVWANLYEGELTTETIPEYQSKEYALDLIDCLRFFHLYATESKRPSHGMDCSPPMRIDAVTQGTLEIDGVTYYYNSADL